MIELIIIADDLTGAIEAGVQLAKQDVPTRVIHRPESDFPLLFSECIIPVLIINTESRHIKPEIAVRRIRDLVLAAKKANIHRFFKKTDSTMRGNIGAELEAFKSSVDQQYVGFIPAHPKLKRITRNGFHYIGEALLHQTGFGKDPLEPISQSYIPDIIRKQTALKVSTIDLSGSAKPGFKNGIIVFDCTSEKHLIQIADFLVKRNTSNAMAGSAAMVELLPDLYQLKRIIPIVPNFYGPSLLVNGSLNRTSFNQVRFAQNNGVKTSLIPQSLLSTDQCQTHPSFLPLLAQLKSAFNSGQDFIISTSGFQRLQPLQPDQTKTKVFEAISKRIGILIGFILEEIPFSSLIVFGGDTLMGIMQTQSCKFITPKMEIQPGVASSLVQVKNRNLHLVTKPGGFGEQDIILNILRYINKLNT